MWTPPNVNTISQSHLYLLHYEKSSEMWTPPNCEGFCPGPKVFTFPWFHCNVCFISHLCVIVEIPEVKATHAVHAGEEGRVDGRPAYVVHIVTVILERVQRTILLNAPQLHRPIKRRREEIRREVDLSRYGVAVDSRNGTLVTLEHVRDPGLAAMTTGRVDGGLLTADDEVVDISGEEGVGCHGDALWLFMLELHAILLTYDTRIYILVKFTRNNVSESHNC